MPEKEFTPTEDLVLDVLVARYRLGEHLWTFDSHVASAPIRKLAEKGWVNEMHGITENTVRAYLTDKAVARFLTFKYIPPIARDDKKLAKKFKAIYKNAKALKKSLAFKEAERVRIEKVKAEIAFGNDASKTDN